MKLTIKKKGVSTAFGSIKKPVFNLSSIISDMDTSDMYEGGRYKRKRGDESDDDGDSASKRDPNAYDHEMAKFRTKLIRL